MIVSKRTDSSTRHQIEVFQKLRCAVDAKLKTALITLSRLPMSERREYIVLEAALKLHFRNTETSHGDHLFEDVS